MRTWIYEQAVSVPGLMVASDNIHSGASLGKMGDSPTRPFAVIKMGLAIQQNGSRRLATDQPFEIWVHDEPGSYLGIDNDLRLICEHFASAYPATVDGHTIVDITDPELSRDLVDEGYRTITRYAAWVMRWRQ